MLVTSDLHAHYGASHIVQGVDLAVGAGEVVGVFGRNGVGKTTLLKTIAGLLTPRSGEIWFEGKRIDKLPPWSRGHLGLGRTFQVTVRSPKTGSLPVQIASARPCAA